MFAHAILQPISTQLNVFLGMKPVIASVNFYTQKKADIEKFYTGDNFLRFKNFCVPYQSTDHSALTITCDMAYDGNCQGVAVVETVFGVKFTLSGVLRHFVGTVRENDKKLFIFLLNAKICGGSLPFGF